MTSLTLWLFCVAKRELSANIANNASSINANFIKAYGKNLRLQMGRCPVRSIFEDALELLREKQHLLGFMEENIVPLTNAVEGYKLFDRRLAQKVILEAQK